MLSVWNLCIHLVILADLLVRIFLAELNRRTVLKACQKAESRQNPKVVASVVGYRESPDTFDRCLGSYLEAGCTWLVVGIDGNQSEDEVMVRIFQQVPLLMSSLYNTYWCLTNL